MKSDAIDNMINIYIDGNASLPRISKMHKKCAKKLFQNKLATECLLLLLFAILKNFAFKFWYKPMILFSIKNIFP